MKKFRNAFFYFGIIGGFSALIYLVLFAGRHLEAGRSIVDTHTDKSPWQQFLGALSNNLQGPLALLLAQIVVIIIVARVLGGVCRRIGQPAVIGEIIAGIVLGPSLLGAVLPEFSGLLFPAKSLSNLNFLSQVGIVLFMFIVGMELDLKLLKNKARDVVVISHASIIAPFALGACLAYFIYPSFAPESIRFSSFALFIGIAMSITAFPVLARILQERGIQKTRIGAMVITCAAVDDVTAWCLLAAVIAFVKAGSLVSALFIIVLAAAYVLLMMRVVRPLLQGLANVSAANERPTRPLMAVFLLTLILSAYATEVIGIHALFGAFMAGVIMPGRLKFKNLIIERLEDITLLLLLPLFFVFTGLRTEIGLIKGGYLWMITGLIILIAVVGKFLGSALAARFVGQRWKDSLSIGALMNTRGLMELIVLNIGYDLGVLNPVVFTMMVIMALLTTMMTGPALSLINKVFKDEEPSIPANEPRDQEKVLETQS